MKKDYSTVSSRYVKSYTSFSGHDMVCVFELPISNFKTVAKVVGSVQTISYSIHNEKFPVRVLGNMNAKDWLFGNRTIAGSLVFTVFDKHWIRDFMDKYFKNENRVVHALTDEMPPFNITISMANEYGDKARLALYGVTFVNEGQVMSIEDIYTENTYQFYAKDIDYLAPVSDAVSGKSQRNQDVKDAALLENEKARQNMLIKALAKKEEAKADNPTKQKQKKLKEGYFEPEVIERGLTYDADPSDPNSDVTTASKRDYFKYLETKYKENIKRLKDELKEKKISKDEYKYLAEATKQARNNRKTAAKILHDGK